MKHLSLALLLPLASPALAADPLFTPVQPDLFSAPSAQSNAWGDYDNDGDLDLVVTFRNAPVRLYRNDLGESGSTFVDVGAGSGLPTEGGNMRGAAWGDYDSDGDLDLYLGYADRFGPPNHLFRNDGGTFTDVATELGVDLVGMTGQVSFVDYDADGDVDFYVAFREIFNRLFRNDGGTFTDVSFASGTADIRRTVGACWFDMDGDGDLDVFTANQNGDRDGMYRNDLKPDGSGRFTDVGIALDMDQPRRPTADGSVGCAVTDFDNDGHLDLYVAEYGHDSLFRSNGDGTFTDVAAELGADVEDHIVTGAWGDFDNDGLQDLYTVGYVNRQPGARDFLFRNEGSRFSDVMPDIIMAGRDADHGVQWSDYDLDGDLDLALAANDPAGQHAMFRNDLAPEDAARGLHILVLDEDGLFTMAGATVRVMRAGTTELIGTRMVDTGTGYKTQNAMPVHVALPDSNPVDIEVTPPSLSGPNPVRFEGIVPQSLDRHTVILQVPRR